jgi:hypothetical protein
MKESEAAERKPRLAPGKMEPMTDDRGATSQDSESQKSERSERERIGVRGAIKRHLDKLSKNLDMRRHARIQADAEVEKQRKLAEIEIEKERELVEIRKTHTSEGRATRRSGPLKVKSRGQLKREADIRSIIGCGSRGAAYCRELDNRGVKIPAIWVAKGCPSKYAEAYRITKWKKSIQNEKSSLRPAQKRPDSRI